jgi:hypothetical protein
VPFVLSGGFVDGEGFKWEGCGFEIQPIVGRRRERSSGLVGEVMVLGRLGLLDVGRELREWDQVTYACHDANMLISKSDENQKVEKMLSCSTLTRIGK